MMLADEIDNVTPEDVTLIDAMLGYDILVAGEHAGAIEGVPGSLELLEVKPPWQEKGVARAALHEFIRLSRDADCSVVTTNHDLHPAMTHILETEGFEEQTDGIGWEKELQ